MNYRLGFFILAIALGGLLSYIVFRPKDVEFTNLKQRHEESKNREDSLVKELNNTITELNNIRDEKNKIIYVYDTISHVNMFIRADSIYNRHRLD